MNRRNMIITVTLAFLLCLHFAAADAARQNVKLDGQVRSVGFSKAVPGQLNYQGYLVDAADSVAVNATLGMTFRLFDSEAKGAELWFEAHPAVDVSNGLFQVLLGSVTVFPAGLFDGTTLWLQTEVGAEVLSPRKPLVSVAYSNRAELADNAERLEGATLIGLDARWVNEDQPGSVTGAMITDGEIVDDDVAVGAAIDPGKIAGTAWTADNDGAGSGLDADLLDGQQAVDFISMDDLDHLDAADGDPANAVYVDDAGNVGIGTTTPGEKLQVTGVIHSTTDGFKFPDGTTQTTAATGGAGDGHSLDAADGSPTDVVYVDNDGNVGVGTTNPGAQLDTPGPVRIGNPAFAPAPTAGLLLIANDATSSSFPLIVMNPSGDYILYAKGDGKVGIGTTSPGAKLEVNYDNSSSTTPAIVIDNPHGVGAQDVLDFRFSGSTQARIRKAAGGDMFIGTVVNDGLNLITNGTNRLKVASDGKVGIGTDSPDYLLDVAGDAGFNQHLYHNGDENTYIEFTGDQIDLYAGNVWMISAEETTQDEVVINEGSADVDFRVESDISTYALFVRGSDSYVGIGTSVPAEKLSVNGNVYAWGYMRTGSPSSSYAAGDIAADDDLVADDDCIVGDDVIANDDVRAHDLIAGTAFQAEDGIGIYDPNDDRLEVIDNIHVNGSITKSGTCSDVMQTQTYGYRLHYADESAEVYHFDRGQGQLQNGEAIISLDPVFLETVTINDEYPSLVQITLTADCQGVFVAEQTATYFKVKELRGGASDATFNWELAAKRKGYESIRLEQVEDLEEKPASDERAEPRQAEGNTDNDD